MGHDFTTAQTLVISKLKLLHQYGYDDPLISVSTGRVAQRDDDPEESEYSEILTIAYHSKLARRSVIFEYDSGVMRLSPYVRVSVNHQEGIKVLKRFEIAQYLERKLGRQDAYLTFSGFWSGLPRAPIPPEEERAFISGTLDVVVPLFENDLKMTLLGQEWPKLEWVPY